MTPRAPLDPRAVRAHVRRYRDLDDRRAAVELAVTLAVWGAGVVVMPHGPWLGVPLVVAGITRSFAIFHAIGHHAYFESRRLDRVAGWILSVIVLTPLHHWRTSHNRHHRVFGDLDADDPGDPILFTCEEFARWPSRKRWCWRLLRDPWFFFLVVPAWRWSLQYLIESRSPLVLASLGALAAYAFWVSPWILLAVYLSAIVAFVTFHLHHAVDRGYRARHDERCALRAALEGSTHLLVPFPLSWCLFGLEFHHIHHLAPAVPPYRMAACHHEAPAGMWRDVTVVTWRRAWAALGHTMWSERERRFARFSSELEPRAFRSPPTP